MCEDYPLVVVDDRGRRYSGAVRVWALTLAESDADQVADIRGKPARVVDTRNGKVCYHTTKGRTKYGEKLTGGAV